MTDYVINQRIGVVHRADCASVKMIRDVNLSEWDPVKARLAPGVQACPACLTAVPGYGEFDQKIDRMEADGQITTSDADTVREFADLLREMGPRKGRPGHDPARTRKALIDHAEFCGFTPADVEKLRGSDG